MSIDIINNYRKLFQYYKALGEKTFEQLSDNELFNCHNESSNSVAIIVNHLSGNMKSRWTNFLTEDGEKTWRKRDQEFEEILRNRTEMLEAWEDGWNVVFAALDQINVNNINTSIYIRNVEHSIFDAITRQIAHYAYHVGQIVHIGKMYRGNSWKSLSIPKGKSNEYNRQKFEKPKTKGHFTDYIDTDK